MSSGFVRHAVAAAACAVAFASPVTAQSRQTGATPKIGIRPFLLVSGQRFAAAQTFEAVFGKATAPFWGGGGEVTFRNGLFIDVAASRFRQTGQRVFRFNNQNFGLGIPLRAKLTPIEVTGGLRFRTGTRIIPYAGAGIGSYKYEEESEFSDASENLSTRHVGYLAMGGVEIRVHRLVGTSVDVQFTHVPAILGQAGISRALGEHDLGGVSARVRVLVGR